MKYLSFVTGVMSSQVAELCLSNSFAVLFEMALFLRVVGVRLESSYVFKS